MSNVYGSTDATTPVRKPLMVLATLPRLISPGESVALPVNIFAMDANIKKVKVEVQTSEFVKITGWCA